MTKEFSEPATAAPEIAANLYAEKRNIFQRINAVQGAIGYIQKDKSVSAGAAGSYKAVTHDAVTAMLRKHLIEAGIAVAVSCIKSEFDQPAVNPDGTHAKQRLLRAEYVVSFINIDQPDDKLVVSVIAHALDNGDKAPGKAASYATKYALLKTFLLETGEDEESRYQTADYDFDAVLRMASEAEDKGTASALIKEARAAAVKAKNGEALKEISSMAKALTNKFGGAA